MLLFSLQILSLVLISLHVGTWWPFGRVLGGSVATLGRSCLPPLGNFQNSILMVLSLAFNFDIVQKLPCTKATLLWL